MTKSILALQLGMAWAQKSDNRHIKTGHNYAFAGDQQEENKKPTQTLQTWKKNPLSAEQVLTNLQPSPALVSPRKDKLGIPHWDTRCLS